MLKTLPADFHLHSDFSADSSENIENILNSAIEKNISKICITDHIDFDYYADGKLFVFDKESYFNKLLKIQERYQDRIDMRIGVETGLEPNQASRLDQFLDDERFDFVIGSSHLVHKQDPYYPEYFENRTDTEAFTEYFESIIENLKYCSNFDVYGHIDYVVRYSPNKNKNYSYALFADLIDSILKTLIQKDKGIEINTAGYRSGLNMPNPCLDIIKRYHELGGKIITIGSDAHRACDIGANFTDALTILKACNFKYYTVFQNRKPEFIAI